MTFIEKSLLVPASLGAILLGGCVWQSDYDKLQARYQQSEQQNAELSSQLARETSQVTRLQGAIKYTVDSDLLFKPGGWEVSARGKQVIASFATKLAPTQQNKLVVSGYTDNAPVGPGLQRQGITSNQELSEKRAQNVMEFLVGQGLDATLVTAQGFSERDPVASNATATGRAKNRRVELGIAAG